MGILRLTFMIQLHMSDNIIVSAYIFFLAL